MFKTIMMISLLFLILISTVNTNIEAASSAKTIGLSDEFVTVTGADAIYGNPGAVNATLDRFTFELGLAGGLWNNLLINDYIDDGMKDDLLDKVEDGFLVGADSNNGFKLVVGSVAISSEGRGSALVELSNDVTELLLKGNEIGKTYNFNGSKGSGAVYGDIGINFSISPEELKEEWKLKDLRMGLTYHQLSGAIFALEGNGTTIITYDENGDAVVRGDGYFVAKYNELEGISDNAAKGSAFDFGVYADLNDKYSLGFSVMNIGALKVNKIHEIRYEYNEATEEFEEVGDSEVVKDEELKYQLPSTIRLGGKMNWNENIDLFADYSYTSYHDGQRDHKFATATELTWLEFLPLRTGISYSTLRKDFDWSAGMGLKLWIFEADLGISDLMGLFNKSQGVEGALNLKIEF
ncbi:hypothetical protein U472_14545 [Orenia metallireducens]|jgi:hypothetical protein|uniref:DUF5723 domain-containing protein n=1 Tax=Orenia metallireducens TaxID=1413210 RepID=A0A1C0A5X7_9FIRM|nr:DUF5723 family protein [Orenia metallireducens]OCL25551.1 hypothetical protein U472_14545 [Orenia metallireducens]